VERLEIIDFCDAAGEWGSTVPIPTREADRMIELADQRRIMDLDDRRPMRNDRHEYDVCWNTHSSLQMLIVNRKDARNISTR
jgi:hypothetical protein